MRRVTEKNVTMLKTNDNEEASMNTTIDKTDQKEN